VQNAFTGSNQLYVFTTNGGYIPRVTAIIGRVLEVFIILLVAVGVCAPAIFL